MSSQSKSTSMNRLAQEKSPYLLQHAANPVDWYPWGREAFEKARREDKVIFLSIGYSTCHWCHVMAHESFENEEIARLLNEHFVSVKVDREERPDIDQIYMNAVQVMTHSGGWPLTVFLTPDLKPFAGGTYFPPDERWARVGMKNLIPRVAQLWKEKRLDIENSSEELTRVLQVQSDAAEGRDQWPLNPEILQRAFIQYEGSFDPQKGGFGQAPKFPSSHNLSFLLKYGKRVKGAPEGDRAREMVKKTLDEMARGGMYDQLGGGFHRYSTDSNWLVPHFEKMLYDQALLAKTYLEAFQASQNPFYADIARDIFEYALRDLRDPGGAFYSAEDADSEGHEGTFYVWRPEEINQVLGPEAGNIIGDYFGATDAGNFESTGKSVLSVPRSLEDFCRQRNLEVLGTSRMIRESRIKLFESRQKRVRPHRDDKVITAWNGLMISAMAYGAAVLDEERYGLEAARAARFLLEDLNRDGRLLRRYRDGAANILAFQDDYAAFVLALLDLYEATFEVKWLAEAKRLTDEILRLFWDKDGGNFFYTAADQEALIVRDKEIYDGAIPSGNSMAAMALLRLSRLLGDGGYEEKAESVIRSSWDALGRYPTGLSELLTALDFGLGPAYEIVIAGPKESADFKKILRLIHSKDLPRRALLHHPPDEPEAIERLNPFIKNQKMLEGKTTVYICRNYECRFPITDPADLTKQLDEL